VLEALPMLPPQPAKSAQIIKVHADAQVKQKILERSRSN
jgi:hypothetical protein